MRYLIPLLAAVALMGCTEAREVGYGTLARGVDEACERGMGTLAMEARMRAVDEINSRTTTGNWTPSDCDGDGAPDFAIGADGMVVRP